MENYKYSKETIKARMIKTAMNHRGIDNPDELDPITKLLIEAITSELYILADDTVNIEVRLLEKLAQILTPTAVTTAIPAHAVMYAFPLGSGSNLNMESAIYYEDPELNKRHNLTNIEFSPICNIELKKARVCRLICNGTFYNIDEKLKKTSISKFSSIDQPASVWIGIDIDKNIGSLKNMSFYIDLPDLKDKYEYLSLLQFSKWEIDGRAIKIKRGLTCNDKNESHSLESLLDQYNTMHVINKDIYQLYENNYITIDNDPAYSVSPCPQSVADQLSETIEKDQELAIPLLWVHIQFPPVFLSNVLDDITIYTNTVPIAQKIVRKQHTGISELNNIIRLTVKQNEAFLAVKSVIDSHDRQYKELYDKNNYNHETGTYSIRHGGCERFDTRTSHELLNRLIDLAVEERAVFTAESKNKMIDTIEEMLQLINRMKETMDSSEDSGEMPYYLIMDCLSPKETIKVEYWVTMGTIGNYPTPLSPLLAAPDLNLDPRFTRLLTSATGARTAIAPQNKIWQYKKVLTSFNRIVTNEDIVNFCQAEYPDIITDVQIKRGCAIGTKPHEGLIRTIDLNIFINIPQTENFNKEEFIWLLKTNIESKSPENYNYRYFIHQI